MTKTQTYYVLNKILYFVSRVIQHAKLLNPDIPIQNQFDDVYCDELDILISLIKLEMELLVEIPDDLLDYWFTFRQLTEAIALLPKIEPDKVEKFRAGKYKMLNMIADKLRQVINR